MNVILVATIGLLLIPLLLWYPWLSVALLLAVPTVKAGAQYYVPIFQRVDLTALSCGLAGVMALWNLIRRPGRGAALSLPWKQLACLLVLGFALFVGLAWTSAPTYGLQKAYRFAGIGIPFLLLPAFFVRSQKEGRAMIHMIILVGTLSAVALVVLSPSYLAQLVYGRGYARATILGSSPIMPAVMSAVGVICVLTGFVVRGSASRLLRYSALIVLPLGLIAILKTGTRSGLLGLLATALLLPLVSGRQARVKAMFILLFAIPLAAGAGFVYLQSSASPAAQRWSRIAEFGGTQELIEGRKYHYQFCLQNWWRKPILGHGSGSFAVDGLGTEEPAWPHNIILEALYETGLVGTVALLAFLLITARIGLRGLRLADTPQERFLVLAPAMLVLLLLMQGMMHWDLDGMRFMYLFAGLLYANVLQVEHARLLDNQSVAV